MSWLSHLKALLPFANRIPKELATQSVRSVNLLAIDFEFTQLDPKNSKFLSAGWISGHDRQIDLQSAYYRTIRARGDFAQSPIIHGLTPKTLAQGVHARDMFNDLMASVANHIVVIHHADLDIGMLRELATRLECDMPDIFAIDTLIMGKYILEKKSTYIPKHNELNLSGCREKMGLPPAPVHNALDDALASLELLYAQLTNLDSKWQLTLGDLARRGVLRHFPAQRYQAQA